MSRLRRGVNAGAMLGVALAGWLPNVLAEQPPRMIEALAQQLAATDKELRREAAYELNSRAAEAGPALPALIKALDDQDKQVWADAVSAIAKMGPAAKDAIPALLAHLESRKSRGTREREKRQVLVRSAYALSKIGPAAIPPLTAALKSDDIPLRQGAAKALGGMGAAASEATPVLVSNLGQSDPELRRETIEALAAIGVSAKAELVASLDATEPLQRASAILALGELGAVAADAAPAVAAKFGKDADAEIRAAVIGVMPKLGWDAVNLRPLIVAGIKDDDARVRHATMNVLLTARGVREQVWPALIEMLKAENANAQQRAAEAIGAFGADAKEAAPMLDPLTKEGQPEEVRKSAVAALAKING